MAFPSTPANATIYTATNNTKYIYITDNGGWSKYKPANTDPKYLDTAVQSLDDAEKETGLVNLGLPDTDTGQFLTTLHTVSGTHTFNPNTQYAIVYAIGAGGGGGSVDATGTDGGTSGGGYSGAVAIKLVDVAAQGIQTSTITIGAAGTGSTSGNAAGTGGSNTVYNDGTYTLTAVGGAGGVAGVVTGTGYASDYTSQPVSPIGGDINIPTRTPKPGYLFGSNAGGGTRHGGGGIGSDGQFGISGEAGNQRGAGKDDADSTYRSGFGAGGSGGASVDNGTAGAGEDGTNGIVIIMEYK